MEISHPDNPGAAYAGIEKLKSERETTLSRLAWLQKSNIKSGLSKICPLETNKEKNGGKLKNKSKHQLK
jgi:hypothetical protein